MSFSLNVNEYSSIIRRLRGNSNEVLESLETLSNFLIFGGGNKLQSYNIQELCALLVNVIRTNYTLKHKELAALCVHNIIETLPLSTKFFIISNIIGVTSKSILNRESNELTDTCIQILYSLTKYQPELIGEKAGIECFTASFDMLCNATKRIALQSIINVATDYLTASFASSLVPLSSIMLDNDDKTSNLAAQAFALILRTSPPQNIPIEVASNLLKALPKVNDDNLIVLLVKAVNLMIDSNKNYNLYLENADFFNGVCFNQNTLLKRTEIVSSVIDQILKLLSPPIPPLPKFLYPYEKLTDADTNSFAINIQPFLIKLIKERLGSEEKVFAALTATIPLSQPTLDSDFVTILLGISQNTNIMPQILAMLVYIKDLSPFADNGFLSRVNPKEMAPTNRKWVEKTILKLRKRAGVDIETKVIDVTIKNIDDIINIANQKLEPFKLLNLAPTITRFLRSTFLPRVLPENLVNALQLLADQIKIALTFYQLPDYEDPIGDDFETFSDFGYPIDIVYEENVFKDISVDLTADLVAIEAWVNQKINPSMVNEKALKRAMKNSELKGLIYFQDQSIKSCSTFGYLARSFGLRGYKKFTFSLDGKIYPALEPFWHVLTTAYDNIDTLLDNKPTFVLQVGDCVRPSRKFRQKIPPNFEVPLNLLCTIHNIAPMVDCVSNQLSNALMMKLAAPSMSSGLYSEAVSMFYHYPYLFNLESRFVCFQIASLDMPTVLHTVETKLTKVADDRQKAKIFKMKVHASRKSIFNDGHNVLAKLPPTLRVDIDFVDEMGFGTGPTQEFYTLLSREFCKNVRKLWRTSESESEFAFSKQGLFPSPAAPSKEMRLFGILCARAIAAGCLIDAPLSEAFFRMLKGEKITLADIDDYFANTLSDKTGLIGLDFTYPGLSDLELKRGGADIEVTEKNVDEYIELINEFSVGNRMKKIIGSFKDGFSQIIPFDCMSIFSPSEMFEVLCGNKVSWSVEYLFQNVNLEHGYSETSNEIRNLFEILTEFDESQKMNFINFVTGSSRLPVGGLAALRPKLTIARKDDGDNHLPSVMTCTNYFKMPAYKSKDVMKEKILFAISEGRNVFSFS